MGLAYRSPLNQWPSVSSTRRGHDSTCLAVKTRIIMDYAGGVGRSRSFGPFPGFRIAQLYPRPAVHNSDFHGASAPTLSSAHHFANDPVSTLHSQYCISSPRTPGHPTPALRNTTSRR